MLALLSEPTIEAAAKTAKVGERTLYTWLKDPAFCAAYREARAEAVSRSVARLQQASGEAVTTLQDVMKDAEAPAPSRVAAAKTVLEIAIRGTEIAELQRRLSELENSQAEDEDNASHN
jgi:hypothetical protein